MVRTEKCPTREDNFMGDTVAEQTTKSVNFDKDPYFPNEWISIAAAFTFGKMTENQKGAMLSTGKEPN